MNLENNKEYTTTFDYRIPVRYLGESKWASTWGVDYKVYKFQEVITDDNQKWCKGEIVWLSIESINEPK